MSAAACFEVYQGDEFCASCEGPRPAAAKEALHYVLMCGQDDGMGPIRVVEVFREERSIDLMHDIAAGDDDE